MLNFGGLGKGDSAVGAELSLLSRIIDCTSVSQSFSVQVRFGYIYIQANSEKIGEKMMLVGKFE